MLFTLLVLPKNVLHAMPISMSATCVDIMNRLGGSVAIFFRVISRALIRLVADVCQRNESCHFVGRRNALSVLPNRICRACLQCGKNFNRDNDNANICTSCLRWEVKPHLVNYLPKDIIKLCLHYMHMYSHTLPCM